MFADEEVLTQCVRRASAAVLVEPWTGRSVTGAQLAAEVRGVAAALARMGIGPGSRVGIGLDRGVDLIVVLLAVAQTGAAYVPLDPAFPVERLQLMVDDAAVSTVIATSAAAADAAGARPMFGAGTRVVTADELRADAAEHGSSAPTVPRSLGDLAYIIYTSGSTGRPKGVMISHANLAAFLRSWDAVVDPGAPGTWLAGTTISFDPSVVELLWTLSRGADVVLARSGGLRGGIGDVLAAHPVTHFQCTPTMARLLLDSAEHREALGRVHHLLIGGEALTPALVERLYATGLRRVTNIYGPTETTVWAFAHDVTRAATAPIPIGRPLPGIRAEVHAPDGGPTAPGTVGELRIGGPSVASGYLGLPELSASRFVDDPAEPGLRWYVTGDLARLEPDGTFTFHGRTDHQVKLNGVRIELGEIEATLEAHPDVVQCAVALRADHLDQDHLVGWFVPREGASPDPVALRRYLGDALPAPLVPRILQSVAGFTLTSTGKVDRNQLPEVAADDVVGSSAADDLDALARDFATALDLSDVGPDDDFFDRGGHSLAATFLTSLIFERTGVRVPLRAVVEAPTPRELARLLSEGLSLGDEHDAQVLVRFGPRSQARQLYVVHGAGGNVMVFRELAARLAPTYDVVGIQAVGVEPGVAPDRTVTAMADRYVRAILQDRATHGDGGPVLLGGYSNGGLIALHMAPLLTEAGVEVGPVALIDSYVDETLPPTRWGQLAAVVASARGRGPNSLTDWARWSLAGWKARYDTNAPSDPVAGATGVPEQPGSPDYAELEALIERATADAPPLGAVAGGAFLVRAREGNPLWRISYDWDHVVGGPVPVQWVAGGHLSLLRSPQVASVAGAVINGFAAWHRP